MNMFNRLRHAALVATGRAEAVREGTGKALEALSSVREKELERELQQLQEENGRLRRRGDELFNLIERILAQRKVWQDMWTEQSAQHQHAQNRLETVIITQRTLLKKVIDIVNGYRTRDNEPLLEKPSDIDAASPPIGTAKQFAESMKVMAERVPPQIDGVTERDAIVKATS